MTTPTSTFRTTVLINADAPYAVLRLQLRKIEEDLSNAERGAAVGEMWFRDLNYLYAEPQVRGCESRREEVVAALARMEAFVRTLRNDASYIRYHLLDLERLLNRKRIAENAEHDVRRSVPYAGPILTVTRRERAAEELHPSGRSCLRCSQPVHFERKTFCSRRCHMLFRAAERRETYRSA